MVPNDEILRGKGDSEIVGMSLIAALVAGPVFVHPEEWLPLIFNGRAPNAFAGTPEHLVANTIFSRHSEASAILADHPEAYRPIFVFDVDRLVVDHWTVQPPLALNGLSCSAHRGGNSPWRDARESIMRTSVFRCCTHEFAVR